jgi:hypothetical protein
MKNSVLNTTVSGFANTWSKTQRPVNLLAWLKTDKYRPLVEAVRHAKTEEEKTELKKRLPCVTVSGQFSERKATGLVQHSGLLCLDIDSKENNQDMSNLKKHLSTLPYIAYVGFSVSGNGLYCIVPISEPQNHKGHFKALTEEFFRFSITVDKSGSDICRLRYYSYDSEAYFNHQAQTYSDIYREPEKPKPQHNGNSTSTSTGEPVDILQTIVENSHDGQKHTRLFRAARLAGGFVAAKRLTEQIAIDTLEEAIKKKNIVSFELAQKTIRDGIATGLSTPVS